MKNLYYLFFGYLFFITSCNSSEVVRLTKGMTISGSVVIATDTYVLESEEGDTMPVLTIEGSDIVVDFNGAVLQGSTQIDQPDKFDGLGILVKGGENITIKNLTVKGYKFGLRGVNVDSLKIINADFSYNYRPKIADITFKKNPYWSSITPVVKEEWLKYGTAIHLKKCDNAFVKRLTITEGMNGLMLDDCNNGLFYNNKIQFNSGIGLGLYRSSENHIMHNQVDWNIRQIDDKRKKSHYLSAGILLHLLSNSNKIAYNSATHCGYGIQLEKSSNDNIIYRNDFSYSPFAGIRSNFSNNRIYENSMVECQKGITGRYFQKTEMIGNIIQNCSTGIDIENGGKNIIRNNDFYENEIGIHLSKHNDSTDISEEAIKRDVSSHQYAIDHNAFNNTLIPFQITDSRDIFIVANDLYGFNTLIESASSNKNIVQKKNNISTEKVEVQKNTSTLAYAPAPLSDAQETMLRGSQLKGQQYIVINEWGPYSFKYPVMWLRTIEENRHVFALFGPQGNWKLINAEGIDRISLKTGTFPATVVLNRTENVDKMKIEFDFIGNEVVTQFGEVIEKGAGYGFGY